MQDAIVAKLKNHLSKPVNTECAVVYLLAETRKLLEQNTASPKPFALWMYCHWALHVDLTYKNTTTHFLQEVDRYVRNTVDGFQPDDDFTLPDEHALFREFLFLDTFRMQLRQFLDSHGLTTDLCDNDRWWFAFMSAYAGVIEDGTLSATGNRDLQAVQKVVFRKGATLTPENHVPFVITWDIILNNGDILTVETTAPNEVWSTVVHLHD